MIDYEKQWIKTHDFYSDQKINFFVMITLLCKGLHNYCTQLCQFESIQFYFLKIKVMKILVALCFMHILYSLDSIQIILHVSITY